MSMTTSPLKVGEFLDLWLAHIRERARAATYEGYECLLRCHVPAELRGEGELKASCEVRCSPPALSGEPDLGLALDACTLHDVP